MTGTYSLIGLPVGARMDHEVSRLARQLTESGRSVACAESCTGGWIAKSLPATSVS
ncbi:MAG: CinA family protein, partial [Pseudomonadota bacterium]